MVGAEGFVVGDTVNKNFTKNLIQINNTANVFDKHGRILTVDDITFNFKNNC